ncbi:MAG: tetratricopeptide repeat protein [Rhodocyclaceae bacterium]
MSLINQMLQDLESRRATLSGDAGTAQDIRSLPPSRRASPRSGFLLGAVMVALLLGVAAWWFLGGMPAGTAPTQTPAPATISPAPVAIAPAPLPPPAAVEPASLPAPLPTPATAAEASPAGVSEKPIGLPPPPAAIAQPSSAPAAGPKTETAAQRALPASPISKPPAPRLQAVKKSGLKVETALSRVPEADVAAAVVDGAAADEGRIEKKMRQTTSRERAENEYRRALGMVNQGRIQEGADVLRGALSEDAGHTGARLALFGLLVEQRRFEDARRLLEEVLARDPAQPRFASRLARLQLEGGDIEGAERTLRKAAAAAVENPEFRAFHAAVLQRLTLHKDAVAEYRAALRLLPQAGIWWMGLGISLEADGKPAEAREAYERARATGNLSVELAAFVDQKLRRLQ